MQINPTPHERPGLLRLVHDRHAVGSSVTKITEEKKRLFLEGVDDRFLQLLWQEIDPFPKGLFLHNFPQITKRSLVQMARKELKYSKRTSDEDVFQALLNTFRRMRRAA